MLWFWTAAMGRMQATLMAGMGEAGRYLSGRFGWKADAEPQENFASQTYPMNLADAYQSTKNNGNRA
jgi:hypothetical protein